LVPGGEARLPPTTIAELTRLNKIARRASRKTTGTRSTGRFKTQISKSSGVKTSRSKTSTEYEAAAVIRRTRCKALIRGGLGSNLRILSEPNVRLALFTGTILACRARPGKEPDRAARQGKSVGNFLTTAAALPGQDMAVRPD
jgi:hypothetical protein